MEVQIALETSRTMERFDCVPAIHRVNNGSNYEIYNSSNYELYNSSHKRINNGSNNEINNKLVCRTT